MRRQFYFDAEPEHVIHMHTVSPCPCCGSHGNLCREDGAQILDWHEERRRHEAERNNRTCSECRWHRARFYDTDERQLDIFEAS